MNTTQRLEAIPLENITIESGFWGERQATNRDRTIPAIYRQMKKTGRLDAWRLDWKIGQAPKQLTAEGLTAAETTTPRLDGRIGDVPKPHIFWDSDAGKWIEAVGYSLTNHPSPEFQKQVDEVVDLIERAQQPDGYLNIFFTAVEPENRWKNLRDWHELYDAGHLIEGAIAYYKATGKRKLLDVLCRYTDLIDKKFGPNEGQKRAYDGHPEIELALVKLYHETGEKKYLNLSKYFIDERGQQPHYFDIETVERGDDPRNFWAKTYRYCQADKPIREQSTAVGHSVRAAYLFSGVADVAAETSDRVLENATRSVWNDLTQHQMYVTGGLGPAHTNEGFTFAYDLPNETAYAETCASIALVFWAQRMFHLDPDSRYIDVMERALYNGVISGVSFVGEHFFYANPLASFPNVNPFDRFSGIVGDHYYQRSEWFDCACCPPNLARMVASVGSYFYSETADSIFVHLYNQNRAAFNIAGSNIQIEQQTNYPWDGEIHFGLQLDQPTTFDFALRIPGWCRDFKVAVNGSPVSAAAQDGYVHLERQWQTGDAVTLSLAMPVDRIAPHPEIRQDAGCVALQRGPVVYCLEEVDNGSRLANVVIPRNAKLTAGFEPGLFAGVGVITGEALREEPADWPEGDGLYNSQSTLNYVRSPFTFKAIPYCFWANRQPGEMRVWIREN